MAISQDWDIDFVNKIIRHNDGTINYDSNTGTAPSQYDYIRGTNSGTVAQILNGGDLGGTDSSSTLVLTNTTGKFQDNDPLDVLDVLYFDGVQNGGFEVGDTLDNTGAVDRHIVVRAVVYDGLDGTIFGDLSGAALPFTDGNILVKSTATTTAVATANIVDTDGDGTTDTVQVNNSALFTSAQTAGATITPPSTAKLVHYDTGASSIPRFALVRNAATDAGATAYGFVQRIYGIAATGSLLLVDSTGTWANNDPVYIYNSVPYDTLQTGEKFRANDFVDFRTDATSDSTGSAKVLEVIETDATSGRIVLLNVSGTITDNDEIVVDGTYIANVDDVTQEYAETRSQLVTEANAGVGPEITEQRAVSQGGLYETSLNPVRDCNALYTYLQDTFDELGALDDTVPMSAQVKLQQYTLINSWKIPDLSFRFLQSGSIQDSGLANIWTNYQTLGTVEGVLDTGFLQTTTPPPQIYVEQNGSVISSWWIEQHIDVLVKVRTNTLPTLENVDGQLIDNGTLTIFAREFGTLYDHFETTTIAGVAPIPLATANDLNNASGTHSFVTTGDASLFTVGEVIVDNGGSPNEEKRGRIRVITGTTGGTIEYSLIGNTQFTNGDAIRGVVSNNTDTINSVPSAEVAGLGTKIIFATTDATVDGTASTGTFVEGEEIIQDVTGAKAILMSHDGVAENIVIGNITTAESATASAGDNWVGQTSAATFSPIQTPQTVSTISRDIGDGNGGQAYNAVLYLNRNNGAQGDTLANMYEWIKYRTRSLETTGEPPSTEFNRMGGPGLADDGVVGQIYITLNTTYPLSKQSPVGTFAGGTFFGAQGVFVQDMADADIRNFQLTDNAGTVRLPPNRQVLTVGGLVSGDRVAVFRRPNSTPGSGILTAEFLADTPGGGVNQIGDTVIRVDSTVQRDHPDSGVVRAENSSTGLYESFNYTSFTSDATSGDFTLDSTLDRNLIAGEEVYVPLIQEQATSTSVSAQIIYLADIPLLARVRKKGILPFEVEGTFGSGGATITAIRTADTIVD